MRQMIVKLIILVIFIPHPNLTLTPIVKYIDDDHKPNFIRKENRRECTIKGAFLKQQ